MSQTQHKFKATSLTPHIDAQGQRAFLSIETADPNTTVVIETDRTMLAELCRQIQPKLKTKPESR
jgi:hypothetical protein